MKAQIPYEIGQLLGTCHILREVIFVWIIDRSEGAICDQIVVQGYYGVFFTQ